MALPAELNSTLHQAIRINSENMGQFERTLIICDEGSSVHYVEERYKHRHTTNSLHSASLKLSLSAMHIAVTQQSKLGKQRLQPGYKTYFR